MANFREDLATALCILVAAAFFAGLTYEFVRFEKNMAAQKRALAERIERDKRDAESLEKLLVGIAKMKQDHEASR